MATGMRSVVLAELRHNGRRAIGAGIAIAIAVAFVVAVLGATQTMQDYFARSAAGAQLAADVVVQPAAGGTGELTEDDVRRLSALPQVAAGYPQRVALLRVAFADGPSFSQVVTDPPAALRWYHLVQGQAPAAAGDVLVDSRTAADLHLALGSALSGSPMDAPRAGIALRVSGIVTPIDVSGFGPRSLIARAADVQTWPGATGPQQVTLRAAAGVDPEALRANVAAAVPGLVTRTGPEAVARTARDNTGGIDIIGRLLLMFTAVALAVATLVISNTFAIVVAQRATQLALARCVGATRRQVLRAVLAEAVVVGALAALAGALLGVLVVLGGVSLVVALVPAAGGLQPVVPVGSLGLAVAVGIAVTLAAALAPARRATRVAPLSTLRPDPVQRVRRVGRLRAGFGLVLVLAGAGVLAVVVVTAPTTRAGGDQIPRLLAGMACGFVAVLGVLVAGQGIAPGTASLLGRPLGLFGPVGRLTAGNAVRNPARVSATSMALFVGVCLITMMSVGAATTTTSLNSRVSQEFPVDVALRSVPPAGSARAGVSTIPRAQVDAVRSVKDVVAVLELRGARVSAVGAEFDVFTGDPAALARISRSPLPLHAGGLLMSEQDPVVDGQGTGQGTGQVTGQGTGPVTLSAGSRTLRVVPATGKVPLALLTPADFDALVAPASVVPDAALLLRVADGADAGAVQAGLTTALESAAKATTTTAGTTTPGTTTPGIGTPTVTGSLPLRAQVEQVMGILLWIATGLLGVSLLISLVGIGNTMALSVLERRSETGVLRALGLTRRQLRQSLTLEAVLLALTGSVLGIGLGIGFGYAGARLLLGGAAPVTGLDVPWPRIGLVVLAAVVAAVVAAVLPGRRAGRVAPTEALAAS